MPQTSHDAAKPRISWVDTVRGVAIWLVIGYHLVYDLVWFGWLSWDLTSPVWRVAGWLVGGLFLVLVGFSVWLRWLRLQAVHPELDHQTRLQQLSERVLVRASQLGAWAVAISVVSWVLFPASFIQFGILHLISVSLVLVWPLVTWRPAAILALVGALFQAWWWFWVQGKLVLSCGTCSPLPAPVSWLFTGLGWTQPGFTSLDYYPVLPWVTVVVVGLLIGKIILPGWPTVGEETQSENVTGFFEWSGRHSLWLYLVHQPILLAGFWLLSYPGLA